MLNYCSTITNAGIINPIRHAQGLVPPGLSITCASCAWQPCSWADAVAASARTASSSARREFWGAQAPADGARVRHGAAISAPKGCRQEGGASCAGGSSAASRGTARRVSCDRPKISAAADAETTGSAAPASPPAVKAVSKNV